MSTEDKKTDNELIAEFMGLERSAAIWDKDEHAYTIKLQGSPHWNSWTIPSEMLFHKSWDWLMPVVEKINDGLHSMSDANIRKIASTSIHFHITSLGFNDPWTCSILGSLSIAVPINKSQHTYEQIEIPHLRVSGERMEPPIVPVYKAIVEFIRWYNTQPK